MNLTWAKTRIQTRRWQTTLLQRLLEMSPAAFERLTQRLLREAGFREVEVLGRSGDGGLDGVGVYRLSLVSFPIYFQCKRYSGSVPSSAVRDFRGAMAGRGEKGLLVTTGTFTRGARDEASRDGAPPVQLIDGEDLCDLLQEYRLGVATRVSARSRTSKSTRPGSSNSSPPRHLRRTTESFPALSHSACALARALSSSANRPRLAAAAQSGNTTGAVQFSRLHIDGHDFFRQLVCAKSIDCIPARILPRSRCRRCHAAALCILRGISARVPCWNR